MSLFFFYWLLSHNAIWEKWTLSPVQMHWIPPLYMPSTYWAQQVECIWTPCWEVLSLIESNLKLVKLFTPHGSTFPLFHGHPCVAQQSWVHLYSNAQHVEPTHGHGHWPAYPLGVYTYRTFYKMVSQHLEVLQESSNAKNSKRGNTRKWMEEETEKLIDCWKKIHAYGT